MFGLRQNQQNGRRPAFTVLEKKLLFALGLIAMLTVYSLILKR